MLPSECHANQQIDQVVSLTCTLTNKSNLITSTSYYFRVIQNIADSRPKVRYLVAVDDSKNSLEEIVKVRAEGIRDEKHYSAINQMTTFDNTHVPGLKLYLLKFLI